MKNKKIKIVFEGGLQEIFNCKPQLGSPKKENGDHSIRGYSDYENNGNHYEREEKDGGFVLINKDPNSLKVEFEGKKIKTESDGDL